MKWCPLDTKMIKVDPRLEARLAPLTTPLAAAEQRVEILCSDVVSDVSTSIKGLLEDAHKQFHNTVKPLKRDVLRCSPRTPRPWQTLRKCGTLTSEVIP